MDSWIVMPRWDEFQHRDMARSEMPPWIKNYTKLLSDDDYLDLTAAERGVLHGLWLEFARARRALRHDTATVSRRLGVKVTEKTLRRLNHAGFIEFSASKPASTLASLEKRREENKELKKDSSKKPQTNTARNRTPFSAPTTPPTGQVNGPATNTENYVRALVTNGVITEPFELDDYDLTDLVRLELSEQLSIDA